MTCHDPSSHLARTLKPHALRKYENLNTDTYAIHLSKRRRIERLAPIYKPDNDTGDIPHNKTPDHLIPDDDIDDPTQETGESIASILHSRKDNTTERRTKTTSPVSPASKLDFYNGYQGVNSYEDLDSSNSTSNSDSETGSSIFYSDVELEPLQPRAVRNINKNHREREKEAEEITLINKVIRRGKGGNIKMSQLEHIHPHLKQKNVNGKRSFLQRFRKAYLVHCPKTNTTWTLRHVPTKVYYKKATDTSALQYVEFIENSRFCLDIQIKLARLAGRRNINLINGDQTLLKRYYAGIYTLNTLLTPPTVPSSPTDY